MDKREAIERLRLFNKKFSQMKESNFIKWFEKNKTPKIGFTLSARVGESPKIERRGPSDEEFNFFLVQVRFFMLQHGESICFNRMNELTSLDFISEGWKSKFKEARDFLNEYMSKESFYSHNNEKLTNKRIFDLFAFGDTTHFTQVNDYEKIVEFFINKPMMSDYLVGILLQLANVIAYVAKANEEEIERLKK